MVVNGRIVKNPPTNNRIINWATHDISGYRKSGYRKNLAETLISRNPK